MHGWRPVGGKLTHCELDAFAPRTVRRIRQLTSSTVNWHCDRHGAANVKLDVPVTNGEQLWSILANGACSVPAPPPQFDGGMVGAGTAARGRHVQLCRAEGRNNGTKGRKKKAKQKAAHLATRTGGLPLGLQIANGCCIPSVTYSQTR